jgi:hypothetical protein
MKLSLELLNTEYSLGKDVKFHFRRGRIYIEVWEVGGFGG